MPDPIPKSLQAGPKPPEEVDGWLRAALKRQPWWRRPVFKLRHERQQTAVAKTGSFSKETVRRLIRAHIDQTTLEG